LVRQLIVVKMLYLSWIMM